MENVFSLRTYPALFPVSISFVSRLAASATYFPCCADARPAPRQRTAKVNPNGTQNRFMASPRNGQASAKRSTPSTDGGVERLQNFRHLVILHKGHDAEVTQPQRSFAIVKGPAEILEQ